MNIMPVDEAYEKLQRWLSLHPLARRSLRSLQHRQRDGILMDPCPLCGQPTHSWIYCRKYKRDICQDHCEDCPWFMGKMLWSCRYSERKKTHENRYLQPKGGRR